MNRRLLGVLGLLVLGSPWLGAWARWVPEGGAPTLLAEASSGPDRTFTLPGAGSPAGWVVLPPGATPQQITLQGPQGTTRVSAPAVRIPGLRWAFQVPRGLRSFSVRGTLPSQPSFLFAAGRPGVPGQAWVALGTEGVTVDLPPWSAPAGATALVRLERSGAGPWRVEAEGEGRSAGFHLAAGTNVWRFAPGAWGFVPSEFRVTGSLRALAVEAVPEGTPLAVDPETLLSWPGDQWRAPDREWFRWAGTRVLALVTADYRVQDAYFKRLAFFVEKTGFRGRLWTDEAMEGQHGWNAHDYDAADLAKFYSEAAAQAFPLHREEVELRDQLQAFGILEPGPGGSWKAGDGAVVGVSLQSPPALRRALFVHEAWHGLYFTTPGFRAGVRAVWDGLSDPARRVFRQFLAQSQYDSSSEPLMVNEFQAYVLQRPLGDARDFFGARVQAGAEAEGLEAAARALDALVASLFGLEAGSVFQVRPDRP